MLKPKAEKLVGRIVTYVNASGVWCMPTFVYDNAQEAADRLIASSDRYKKIQGYLLQGLTYFANGEHPYAINSFEKLFEFDLNPEIMGLYISTVVSQGDIEKADYFYNKYKSSLDKTTFFLEVILLNRVALDLNKSNGHIQEYIDKGVSEEYIELMKSNHKLIEEDLTNIRNANLEKALVQEVLAIATQVITKVGNFNATFRSFIDKPNDDLHINMYASDIDFETMDKLNESWLEAMVEHESEYDFADLSRVLVNFRPEDQGLLNDI